ncbi:hypothetical protein DAPPUDRAFT_330037 [Daphnia pulex]|uniref:Uncharacterized protein n=1 Tax=Daphnia pulex TaxID=6669 RepID=E9HID2_DAPPU|nr:hypothetical protein DAPPUDRAFT_330037 [Daphnia pulex]|eukprot:EFX68514.1 hypothetical protein DAPPUDRAFT_330037 [Daphnia pulex]
MAPLKPFLQDGVDSRWHLRKNLPSAKLRTMTVTFPGDCTIYTADEYKQNYMLCAGTAVYVATIRNLLNSKRLYLLLGTAPVRDG